MSAPANNSLSTLDTDWSRTDVGHPDGWPLALRVAADLMLNSPLPTVVMWGRQQVMLLNAAYAAVSGLPTQPPGGRIPAMQPSAWSWNPAVLERAWQGESLVFPGQALHMWRTDGVSEQRFDLYYTPLRDADGAVLGIVCTLAPPSAALAPAATRALRMLVVEDNLDAQYLVCEMLRALGHEVDAAADGERAQLQLDTGRYDVLFTDVSLPGISGVELARRAVARWPGLHVIFASGYSGTLTQQLDFPADAIQKPYDIEQLQALLDQVPRT